MKYAALTAIAVGGLALAACEKAIEAPFDPGVCYAVEAGAEGEAPRFNKVADNQPQIEFCAARLEEVRLRFLRMGGSRQEITGSYQGQFIFIDRGGVWLSKTLDGGRFNAMARTGDGRLAMPGAIQRAIDGTPIAVSANPKPDPTAPPTP
ncbi:hypothetical protein [Brevundimonas sp.]|uniref:hypothetical protein n=1 Tax=Brevundimonas sp. TaxID=1871086 RepID=UPI002730FC12|nr:hypothetical protein [Brevundimonas sp.]MDP1913952.1 hypothetical protein [Brevundimonas sp.]